MSDAAAEPGDSFGAMGTTSLECQQPDIMYIIGDLRQGYQQTRIEADDALHPMLVEEPGLTDDKVIVAHQTAQHAGAASSRS